MPQSAAISSRLSRDRDHPALLEAAERLLVLRPAAGGDRVDLGLGEAALPGHPLGRGQHALARVRVAAEGVQHPVLALRRAAGRLGGRVDDVRAVARAVGQDDEPPAGPAGRRGVDRGDRRRARLHDQRPGDRVEAELRRQRRRAVERLLLRDRQAEHELVDLLDPPLGERAAGDLGGDVEARDLGRRPLPAHERRRPGRVQRDVRVLEFHLGLTAIVTRLTATSRSSESVWSTSQTHVVRPRCRARARAVI